MPESIRDVMPEDLDTPLWVSHSGIWYLYPSSHPDEYELEHATIGRAPTVWNDGERFHWSSDADGFVPKCVMRGVELFLTKRGVQ